MPLIGGFMETMVVGESRVSEDVLVEESPLISSEEFRKALRHFPAGVTIVTIRTGERTHGLTVSAFASVSAEPPLIAIIIENRHKAFSMLQEPEAVFAVNILGEEQ